MTEPPQPPDDRQQSAEVVLTTPTGTPHPPITSENIAQYQQDPTKVEPIRRWFRDQGFDTGELTGISFTVTGPRSLFEQVLGPGDQELPLTNLPTEITEAIEAVTFSPPPDFGPPAY
ncbi:hypothetical protein ACFQ1S_29720 [Kibdelosporangium lantanae]|uniref:Uncharacterized protein n=1 Tax=Kibdelosporangium lantanae TaxID=1497396 RepID=A0ABW3MH75_9PSEU